MSKEIQKKLQELLEQRRKILSGTSEQALNIILDAPNPPALVRSFSEEDLYFLINDIGMEDALPITSLASDRQWEFMLDAESWDGDRLDNHAMLPWISHLLKADSKRAVNWFVKEKTKLFELFLYHNIQVIILEEDQDPSDFDDAFFTFDGTFYIGIMQRTDDSDTDPEEKKERYEMLKDILQQLAVEDISLFHGVMAEFTSILPSEVEEECFRLKNVRMAEKGFLPFDEAIGIYQPLKPEDIDEISPQFYQPENKIRSLVPVPVYSPGLLSKENIFTKALRMVDSPISRQLLQTAFAGLSNQIISADQKSVKTRDDLKNIIDKASGYLSIGLSRILWKEDLEPAHAATIIQKHTLDQIFRIGFGAALSLKWEVDAWRKSAWFEKEKLVLAFWDEKWVGILGGLMIKRPMFYDAARSTGQLYREFETLEDIRKVRDAITDIFAFDELLAAMNLSFDPVVNNLINYKSLLLTCWARYEAGLSDELIPLDMDDFKQIFIKLWVDQKAPRKIDPAVKESFLNWIAKRTGIDSYVISNSHAQTLENLFAEIEEEYGSVHEDTLNPKYIRHFLLTSNK
ncbi:MAG: DUF6178 family protein [Desulfobacterales bacterium]|nr:DUF6178 family protein [Desulfobacterales bacterium]